MTFTERPYFSLEEIERTCADELLKVGLLPQEPGSIRIDRFIEKRFKIDPKFEDLPDGILGYTKFGAKGVQEIVISRTLNEENSKVSERRTTSTLAHECGHGLFHAYLFALGKPSKPLLNDGFDHNETKILCRKETVDGIQDRPRINCGRQWWEFQANMAIGGLLLPRKLVMGALRPFLVEKGQLGTKYLDPTRKESAARALVEVFDVNPIVAKIRIDAIFPPGQENQLAL